MMFKSFFPSRFILAVIGQFLEEVNTQKKISTEVNSTSVNERKKSRKLDEFVAFNKQMKTGENSIKCTFSLL